MKRKKGIHLVSGAYSVPDAVLGPLPPVFVSQVVLPARAGGRIVTVGLPGSKATTLHCFWAYKTQRFLKMNACFTAFAEIPHVSSSRGVTYKHLPGS